MTRTEYLREEDRPLLELGSDTENSKLFEEDCETAVTRGAVNYLGKWPAHLYGVFITGLMIFAGFTLFGIIVAALVVPSEENHRVFWNSETSSPNLYFVKHENRTWNSKEFCYIENTARRWKNLTIYLINLVADNREAIPLSKFSIRFLDSNSEISEPISVGIFEQETGMTAAMIEKQISSEERKRRRELTDFYSNVKNIDVPIQHLFNGSLLENVCDNLSSEMLELAARAYVIWNFPGVAIDPEVNEDLESLKGYLRKCENDDNCLEAKAAAVKPNGDILASSVPCQAFIGYLIREIAKNDQPRDREQTIQAAIDKFCPRSFLGCSGVQRIRKTNLQDGILGLRKPDCPAMIPVHSPLEKNMKKKLLSSLNIDYNNRPFVKGARG